MMRVAANGEKLVVTAIVAVAAVATAGGRRAVVAEPLVAVKPNEQMDEKRRLVRRFFGRTS
jgi:hypothetical protein